MTKGRAWLGGSIAALILVPVLVALFLFVRLAAGPLSIAVFSERIEARLADSLPGLAVDFTDVRLSFDRRQGVFLLQFVDTGLDHAPSGLSGQVGDMTVDLPWRPLLDGRIAPREVTLAGLDFELAIAMSEGEGLSLEGFPELILPAELVGLVERSTEVLPSSLRKLALRDARLSLTGTTSGEVRKIDGIELAFSGPTDARRLTASARLVADDRPAGTVTAALERGQLRLGVEGLRPDLLAAGLPGLERLAGIALPLAGELALDIAASGAVEHAVLELRAAAGVVALPDLFPEGRPFSGMTLVLAYDLAARSIRLDALALDFAGQTLEMAGEARWAEDEVAPRLTLAGGFGALDMTALVDYWPAGRGAGGRRWIAENIETGRIEDARLALDIAPGSWTAETLPDSAFSLDFRFHDLLAHYLRPMPPVRAASGRGRLSATGLVLDISDGTIEELPVAGSQVRLTDFDGAVERGEINLALSGEMAAILRLIDHQPLGYATEFGIDPDEVAGRADLSARLALSLLSDLAIGQVEISVAAEIEGLEIAGLVGENGLEAGDLHLEVDRDGLAVRGTARLAGVEMSLDWREDFEPAEGAPSSHYRAQASVSAADLERLGYATGGYFGGRALLDLDLTADRQEIRGGHMAADLTPAALDLPELGWSKPAGTPATLGLGFDLVDGRVRQLTSIAFDTGADSLRAEIRFGATGRPEEARLDKLRLGRTELAGSFSLADDGAISLALAGPALDAEALLASFDTGDVGTSDAPEIVRPLDITLAVDRVFGIADEVFEAVEARARRSDRMWLGMHLDARHAGGKALTLDLSADGKGERVFSLLAEDAGHALAGFGLFDQVEGGRMAVKAGLSGHGRDVRISGRADITGFRLLPGPRIDTEIDAETRGRLAELVGPEGMRFSEMVVPFTLAEGIIDIDAARANGPRMGLTAEGQIDQAVERININGVIVPAYWANSLLGQIPLLGGLFSGGEGGGLFALSYRIKGSTSDPEVSVSSLSLLLPGILRRPFERSKGTLEPSEKPPGDGG